MARLINPRVEVLVKGDTDIELFADEIGYNVFFEWTIEKHLEEEPNSCELRIFNLNEDTRTKLVAAANQSAPIEVHTTPTGVDSFSTSFVGEISDARNTEMKPGHETYLHCESQKTAHKNIYYERNFDKDTPINTIIDDMVKEIGLPKRVIDSGDETVAVINGKTYQLGSGIPSTGILLAQRFSGPAFPILKRYCYDLGLKPWINDGVLYIGSIYNSNETETILIDPSQMRRAPIETTREDDEMIEQQTVVENLNIDPLRKIRKRKSKTVKKLGTNDYSDFTAVDITIPGFDLHLVNMPSIQPDSLLTVDTDSMRSKILRVVKVNHVGESEFFDEYDTRIECDAFEESEYGVDSVTGQTPIPPV